MGSKPVRVPQSYRDLLRLFFQKIIAKRPQGWAPKPWLDSILGASSRHILEFEASQDFRMPGLSMVAGSRAIQGIGFREVRTGNVVWVRTDDDMPNQVDVEFSGGAHNNSYWFRLNRHEWLTIRSNLKRVEDSDWRTPYDS